MRIALALTAAWLVSGAAFGQTAPAADAQNPPADGQAVEGQLRDGDPLDADAEEGEELSELERLSQTNGDPFDETLRGATRQPISVTLRALDKITARYRDIEIAMHEIARFGSLELQPRYCDKRPPEEFPETSAFLEIFDTEHGARGSDLKVQAPPEDAPEEAPDEALAAEADASAGDLPAIEATDIAGGEIAAAEDASEEPAEAAGARRFTPMTADMRALEPAPEVLDGPQADGVNIFRGWMFASSPALNALEHPVYDVWVIDCKTVVAEN